MATQQTIRPDLVPPGPVPRRLDSFKALLERLSRDRWISWVLVIAVAAAYGELASEWTPRGPLSAFQALTALGLGLLVGMAAGLVSRTRWAMLVAPAAFALTFELGRLDVAGPTVDSIHLDTTYGIMAFVVGRGVHGLLTLLPMVLGAALGAAWARRWWPAEARRTGALHATGWRCDGPRPASRRSRCWWSSWSWPGPPRPTPSSTATVAASPAASRS